MVEFYLEIHSNRMINAEVIQLTMFRAKEETLAALVIMNWYLRSGAIYENL